MFLWIIFMKSKLQIYFLFYSASSVKCIFRIFFPMLISIDLESYSDENILGLKSFSWPYFCTAYTTKCAKLGAHFSISTRKIFWGLVGHIRGSFNFLIFFGGKWTIYYCQYSKFYFSGNMLSDFKLILVGEIYFDWNFQLNFYFANEYQRVPSRTKATWSNDTVYTF